jgi:exodeoxyribonuclease VII large subunit
VQNRLARLNIGRRLETDRRRQTAALTALQHAMRRAMDHRASRLDSLRSQLLNLSPLSVLERGYALAYGPEGRLLCDAAQVATGDNIDVRLAKGRLSAQVTKSET